MKEGFPLAERNPVMNAEDPRKDCSPFSLDDDSSGPDLSFGRRRPSMNVSHGFSLDSKIDGNVVSNTSNNMDPTSNCGTVLHKPEDTGFRLDSHTTVERNLNEPFLSYEQRTMNIRSRGTFISHNVLHVLSSVFF